MGHTMSYYHTPSSTERGPGRLEVKMSDGALLGPPETGWTTELAQLCGFAVVAETAQPADTATQTYTRSLTFPGGVPTVTWTVRLKSQAQLDAVTANTTAATITTQATTALGVNRTFLALATPTNAQVVAQVRALTRQNNGIIRLLVNRASLIDGTVD